MTTESRHISEWIDRPAAEVYEYAVDPANLPQWAPGRVGFAFVPRNEYGVLDHHVTVPSGEVLYIPLRVIADERGCEVVFTLRRRPGMTDEDFAADMDAVAADLTRLRQVLEGL